MNTTFDQSPGLYLGGIFVGLMLLLFVFKLLFGQPRHDYVPLPGHKPRLADDGVPWYLKFLYSRGKFSPRLLAMWLDGAMTVRVIEHALGAKAYMVGTTLIQPFDCNVLIGTLVAAFITLSGFGTIQTTVLGDLAPAPGAGNTPAKESADGQA